MNRGSVILFGMVLSGVIFTIYLSNLSSSASSSKSISDEDNSVLTQFKGTLQGKAIIECSGIDGDSKWSIYNRDENHPYIKVINVDLTSSKKETFRVQYLVNTKNGNIKPGFMGDPKKKNTNLVISGEIQFQIFCLTDGA